jgi:hypothetical protein
VQVAKWGLVPFLMRDKDSPLASIGCVVQWRLATTAWL